MQMGTITLSTLKLTPTHHILAHTHVRTKTTKHQNTHIPLPSLLTDARTYRHPPLDYKRLHWAKGDWNADESGTISTGAGGSRAVVFIAEHIIMNRH